MLTATQIVCGSLLTGSKTQRVLAALLPFFALVIPWLMPNDIPLLRAILALAIIMTCLRSIDLARENKSRPLWFRIVHVALPFDTRRMQRARPEFRAAQLAKVFLYLAITFAATRMIIAAGPPSSDLPRLALRWLGGLLFAYALTDVAYGGSEVLFRALGFDLYELHRAPAASLSVKEFWGDRWNRTVSAWFREHCLKPLAKITNAKIGMLGAFVVSGIIHAYLVLVASTVTLAFVMIGYFVLQAVFVFFEIALHENRWSPTLRRVWTLFLMIVSSPAFIEPALKIFGF